MDDTFAVTIQGPQAVLWQGVVRMLASENSEGPFSIYAGHAQFMTILDAVPIVIEMEDGSEVRHEFSKAVLIYANNLARIFVQPTESISM